MNLIIDGNNLAYRCKYSYSLSFNGKDTSVTYGVIKMLISYIKRFKPSEIFVVFDGGIPEYRRRLVPDYKANRHNDEDKGEIQDIYRQIDDLADYILPLLSVNVIRMAGFEADDVICELCKTLSDNIIISNDKDLFQCISQDTRVFKPSNTDEKEITLDNFEEVVGIDKEHYILWRAIQGDKSDNIIGVRGIGEKTATKIIKECLSLDGILQQANCGNLGRLSESILEFGAVKLFNNIDVMTLGKLECVIELPEVSYNDKLAKQYFIRNGFNSLLSDITYFRSLE